MIYHITNEDRWNKALETGIYTHESLKTEGFIHCSRLDQLHKTLSKHFANENEVIILKIVDRRIKELIKIEQLEGAFEPFHHIYGEFKISAVEDIEIWNKNDDGTWEKV